MDGIAWLQGEGNDADHGGSWDKESYKQLLLTLVDDMIADCMTITGQALPPAFFTYQTGASYTRDVDSSGTPGLHVGMAQLEVAIEKKHVYMVGPVYPMTDKGGHLDANGSRWFGCMIGKVWHKVVEQGQHWEPLRPICISRQGNEVYVEFHVPEPPLVFDRPYVLSTALDYKDRGFKVTDTSSNTLPIRMVDIVANTVVKITLASSPSTAAGLYVWYASQSTGGNGCLRDSDPMTSFDTYEFIPERGMYPEADVPALVGKRYPLHNWCVAFHLPVGYGD